MIINGHLELAYDAVVNGRSHQMPSLTCAPVKSDGIPQASPPSPCPLWPKRASVRRSARFLPRLPPGAAPNLIPYSRNKPNKWLRRSSDYYHRLADEKRDDPVGTQPGGAGGSA
ncbi:MAG: hypothetical protein R3D55_10590 [Chloroflexota bacterium]